MEDPATKVHEEIAAMRARMRAEKQEEPPTIELMTPVSVHEDLGQVTILGLEAWGRRITTTTPAGALGNSAPLVNTWERWVTRRPGISGLLVRDVRDDLLNGKRTEELVKFTQSEPDPSVFQPPAGYEIENKEVPVPACPSTEGAEQPMAPIPPPPPPPEQ
jgi:hypothetical protein